MKAPGEVQREDEARGPCPGDYAATKPRDPFPGRTNQTNKERVAMFSHAAASTCNVWLETSQRGMHDICCALSNPGRSQGAGNVLAGEDEA